MRGGALFFATSAVMMALAGCVGDEGSSDATNEPVDVAPPLDTEFELPTGDGAYQFLQDFVMQHPYRLSPGSSNARQGAPLPTMVAAREYLKETLASYNLTVVQHDYRATGANILGIQPGARWGEQWFVLSCHYDTTETTVYGAWDDGSGCAALLEMARTFSTMTWNRTLVYAFFDEEEKGLVGSAAFVKEYAANESLLLAGNINLDPPGLNWPCGDTQGKFPVQVLVPQAKVQQGVPGYDTMEEAVLLALERVGVPEEFVFRGGFVFVGVGGAGLVGTSDHASFDRLDVPNLYIGGGPQLQAGLVQAAGYQEVHTPLDTAQELEQRCGGADLLKQAYQVAMDLTLHALRHYDAAPYARAA